MFKDYYIALDCFLLKKGSTPSANEWIKKLWYIYKMEFYSAERKKELIPFATA